ncbi:MAG: HAD family hydrolase [Candidatus Cloacimonetes bacterium]|nr:HAD family hydrolase [Candidatus Cloacimonadota bacterium]
MKAVFLDRDGTINQDFKGYISKPEDFHLYPFAAEAIKLLNEAGFLVFVITNQSGIARGYYTLEDLAKVHAKLNTELSKSGAKIDDIFVSPYHLEGSVEPYNVAHEDRKPNIGLFKQAKQKYNFKINESFMVGDKYSDIGFGKNSHLSTILVKTGEGAKEFEERENWDFMPDFLVEDLLAAAKLILEIAMN